MQKRTNAVQWCTKISHHPTGILMEQTKLSAPFASHEQLYISYLIGKCPNALTVGTGTDFQNLKNPAF